MLPNKLYEADSLSGRIANFLWLCLKRCLLPENPFCEFGLSFPFPFQVILFVIYNIGWYATCAYLFWYIFTTARESSFISLDPNSGNCSYVPVTVDGTFLIDEGGAWSSNNSFNYDKALYSAHFKNVKVTERAYPTLLDSVFEKVQATALRGENRDYAWNAVRPGTFMIKLLIKAPVLYIYFL